MILALGDCHRHEFLLTLDEWIESSPGNDILFIFLLFNILLLIILLSILSLSYLILKNQIFKLLTKLFTQNF